MVRNLNIMETINLICFKCKHSTIGEMGCKAFPDGDIPDSILSSNKHDKPIEGQKNNFVFEPI